jgi:hypothetical protein
MRRSPVRNLIDRGRRAGLSTSELYSALAGHRAVLQELQSESRDGNGFRLRYDATGQQVYQAETRGRSE